MHLYLTRRLFQKNGVNAGLHIRSTNWFFGESRAQNVSLERSKNATTHLEKHHNKQYHKNIAHEIADVWSVNISLLFSFRYN